jgi:CBS domain-containing protein
VRDMMARIRKRRVHRFIIVDDDETLVGVVGLSDLLALFCS